ncbi:MAG: hypothetical protein V1846_01085 [Candidatus Komeilibacteria bacterium]
MNIFILSLIFFLALSIMLYDLDFRKARKLEGKSKDELNSFKWVGLIYLICIVSWITILFISWKIAVLGVVVYYASTFIRLPQFIGKIIISPFGAMTRHEESIEKIKEKFGLSSEELSSLQKDWQKFSSAEKLQKITDLQEKHKKIFKETTGVDAKDIIPEVGKEILWEDIVNHTFRVLDFDRNGTIVDENNQLKAKSRFQPYAYLLAESPIMNNRVKMPIIHRDDFLLAASVFDDPKLSKLIGSDELLVVYAPQHLGPKGTSASPRHVLHYALVPSGTLDSYYSVNNDAHFVKPEPQKLFGSFVYLGEIKVQINSHPKF